MLISCVQCLCHQPCMWYYRFDQAALLVGDLVARLPSAAGVMNFPLFEVGMRHTTQNWHLLPPSPANSSNSSAASSPLRGPRLGLNGHKAGTAAGYHSVYGTSSMGASSAAPAGSATPAAQQASWHQAPSHPMLHQQRQLHGSRLQPRHQRKQQQQQQQQQSRQSVGDDAGGEEGPLPYSLQGYTPDQVKLICLSPVRGLAARAVSPVAFGMATAACKDHRNGACGAVLCIALLLLLLVVSCP
jgi:hypothetical protein